MAGRRRGRCQNRGVSAEPRIVLYGPRETPYTEKVVRALRLKGLPFRLVEPTRPEDYARWSPRTGLLPVIDLDGDRVGDSAAILDALDERFPEPPLLARASAVAREQRRLEHWVGETFFYYLFRWLRGRLPPDARPRDASVGEPLGPLARVGMLGEDGRPRPEFFDTSDGGPGPEFERKVAQLEQLLGSRPYFFADRISRADIAVFAFVGGLAVDRYPGGRTLVEAHPGLRAHTERVDLETGGA